MTQENKECEKTRDRIAESVDRAIHEMVLREDPNFYEGNGPHGEVGAALVIAGLRRRSEEGIVLEAVSHFSDRSEVGRIWKSIHEMSSQVLADLEEPSPSPDFNGLADA